MDKFISQRRAERCRSQIFQGILSANFIPWNFCTCPLKRTTIWPCSSMDRAIGLYPIRCGFESHQGLFMLIYCTLLCRKMQSGYGYIACKAGFVADGSIILFWLMSSRRADVVDYRHD